jgi:RNA polymerase sigma-70 factor (ECF subfamily)
MICFFRKITPNRVEKELFMNVTDEEVAIDVASREDPLRSGYLVSAARVGSDAAFAELREIYSQRVYRQLLTITKNREDAEDALQDAFLRAYLALHTFEGRSSFYTWLTRIAINCAMMILRKRRIRPEISFNHPNDVEEDNVVFQFRDAGPTPEQTCVQRQLCARLLRSIRKLQPPLRKVIELQMKQSCSVREIAQTLDISEAAVKSRLLRARARLTAAGALRGLRVKAQIRSSSFQGGNAA